MNRTQKITIIAMLSALSIITNMLSTPILGGSAYLSFTYIPAFVAGIYFGVIMGGSVGLIGDIVGCIIAPKGAFNPLILLASMLLGVIPALVWKVMKTKDIWKLLVALVLTALICTFGINTFANWFFYSSKSKTFVVYLVSRLPQLVVVVLNGAIIYALLNASSLKKYIGRLKN